MSDARAPVMLGSLDACKLCGEYGQMTICDRCGSCGDGPTCACGGTAGRVVCPGCYFRTQPQDTESPPNNGV